MQQLPELAYPVTAYFLVDGKPLRLDYDNLDELLAYMQHIIEKAVAERDETLNPLTKQPCFLSHAFGRRVRVAYELAESRNIILDVEIELNMPAPVASTLH